MGGSCCKKKEPQKIEPENPEDPGTFSFRQESERNSPFKSQKKETPPMDKLPVLTAPEIMLATFNSAVINNLIRTMKGEDSYRGTLEYPASYKVPRNNSVQFGVKKKGKWENFESHKYLAYNIAEQYKQKRYLPQIPDHVPYKAQEAFMTLNLLRDDYKNFIEQVLIPLKQRFILEEEGPVIGRKREIRYYSYTFGTVLMENGPEIINELIDDILRNKSKIYLKWNALCQAGANSILENFEGKLLDDFKIKKLKYQTNIEETLLTIGALDVKEPSEVIDFKTQAGFEIIIMMLIDDKNPDRKVRKMLLNREYRYFGLGQINHLQYDFINCLVLCQDIQGEYFGNDKLDATVMQDQLELDDRTVDKLNPTDKFEISQFNKHKNVDSLTNFTNNIHSATTQKGKKPKWVYKNGKFDMGDSLDAQNTYNELQKVRKNLNQNGLYEIDKNQMSGTREFNIEPDILGEDRLSEY